MKRIVILVVIFFVFIISINAKECDSDKHNSYYEFSSRITYDNSYSKSKGTFNITLFNVLDDMYVMYNKTKYKPNSDNEVIISSIKGGTDLQLYIYANDGCDELRIISIKEPYYNSLYGTSRCEKYVGKLVMCSSQFTSEEVNASLLERAIYNYEHDINQDTDVKSKEKDSSLYDKTIEFLLNWGVKIALFLITILITVSIFDNKYRKIKHGI